MSKHTPAPWLISSNNVFLIRAGNADTGRHIAQVGPANFTPSFAVDEHNARLIAAAPDLLEALIDCLECEFSVTDKAAIEKARAAIAKATGEGK